MGHEIKKQKNRKNLKKPVGVVSQLGHLHPPPYGCKN